MISKTDFSVSKATVLRLPSYLRYLKRIKKEGVNVISSTKIATDLSLNPVQVRKDLAAISSGAGKPKIGFKVNDLINDISEFLGYDNNNDAVLVGVGRLGNTLLNYTGFNSYGLNIVAGFDTNPDIVGKTVANKPVYDISELPRVVKEQNIKMGIITVPKECAQKVCNLMISSGIVAIWTFSHIHLNIPDNIVIKYEDMAASLALLSNQLHQLLNKDKDRFFAFVFTTPLRQSLQRGFCMRKKFKKPDLALKYRQKQNPKQFKIVTGILLNGNIPKLKLFWRNCLTFLQA